MEQQQQRDETIQHIPSAAIIHQPPGRPSASSHTLGAPPTSSPMASGPSLKTADDFERAHDEYMKKAYGVVVENIDESSCGAITSTGKQRQEDEVRILQWNILADGLSDDGFLVRDVLHASPQHASSGDQASRDAEFHEMQERVQKTCEEAKKDPKNKEETLKRLKAEFAPPKPKEGEGDKVDKTTRERAERMTENHKAIVDWKRRWLKMRELIARYDPDVITLQEVDRLAEIQRDLHELGCARPPPIALARSRGALSHAHAPTPLSPADSCSVHPSDDAAKAPVREYKPMMKDGQQKITGRNAPECTRCVCTERRHLDLRER